MGTKCECGTPTSTSSNSPKRCFSPSRKFSSYDEHQPCLANFEPLDSDVCGSIKNVNEPNLPLTQKRRLVPYYGVHMDKEGALEEVLALLNAFQDQKYHLRVHKMHHNTVNSIKDKLENNIDFLETSGLEAARTGTLTKLKSKLKGARFRISDLSMKVATNSAEVRRLQMHPQVSKTQEMMVERDEFATEVRRLQKCVRHLRKLHKKVLDDNSQLVLLREEMPMLIYKNEELETSVMKSRKCIEEMGVELEEWKAKEYEAKYRRASEDQRLISLQGESKSLTDLLVAEKLAMTTINLMVNEMAYQARMIERETRESESLARDREAAEIRASSDSSA